VEDKKGDSRTEQSIEEFEKLLHDEEKKALGGITSENLKKPLALIYGKLCVDIKALKEARLLEAERALEGLIRLQQLLDNKPERIVELRGVKALSDREVDEQIQKRLEKLGKTLDVTPPPIEEQH